jgi:hypothetical protein
MADFRGTATICPLLDKTGLVGAGAEWVAAIDPRNRPAALQQLSDYALKKSS